MSYVRVICAGVPAWPHGEVTVYSRKVDLARQMIADDKRTFEPGVDAGFRLELLDKATLHCEACGRNERGIPIDDLTKLLVRLAENSVESIPLSAVRSSLRAIR